jgi:hypothetical protein
MLDCWGYLYLTTGAALAYAETALEQDRARTGGAVAGHGTSKLDPNGMAADLVENQCNDVLRLMEPYRDELGPILMNIELLKIKLQQSRKHHALELFTNDILDDVRRIKNDFMALLSERKFYYLPPGAAKLYGQPQLFGEAVSAAFPEAQYDIERAGNCVALGEGTACIMHLMRAMEVLIWRLAEKLKAPINPKSTWGNILEGMDQGIKKLPHSTEDELRRKEEWSDCYLTLRHVKQAWRDPSMHAARTWDEKEAREILEKTKSFATQLVTLL